MIAARGSSAAGAQAPRLSPVRPAEWRAAAAARLADGWRFAGLYAAAGPPAPALRLVLTRAVEALALGCHAPLRRIDSIVDLAPAAAWDEREAHDLHGWSFAGHEPLRALVDHGAATDRWTVPLEGRDAYQVAVGPIHAGVIESGHFRFSVVGDRVLHVDLRLFYKHRGLQAAAEGERCEDAIAYVRRACAADAVANTVAYAQACEAARGLWPQPDTRRARTLLLELERLYNHLNDVGAICAGVGFAPGATLFAALKERAQRLNASLAGHRFLFDAVRVGASALRVERGGLRDARDELERLRADVARGWRELDFAGSLQERLGGVGVTRRADVEALGGVGPAARAAGVARDARTSSPRLSYAGFEPAAPPAAGGDVAARMQIRGAELDATFGLLDGLLRRPLAPAGTQPGGEAGRLGLATVESPRGQTLCAVELERGRVARLHLRTGSYANWPLVALAARGDLLPDFPLINKSFELCYACVDR